MPTESPRGTRTFSVRIPTGDGSFRDVRVLDFIQNFLWIRPKPKTEAQFLDGSDDAPLVRFVLNPQQLELYLRIEDDWRHYRHVAYVILKARQIGFSTLIAAILFTMTLYSPYRESLVVSDKDDHTERIFQMYQRFYDNLPEALRPALSSNKRGTTLSTANESTIQVETVSEDLARGATLRGAHLSEFGMWRKQKEALASLANAVPTSPDSMIFIESTAKGMNFFRELYRSAESGQNRRFRAHFAPWYRNAGYVLPYYGEELMREGPYGDEVRLYGEYEAKGMTLPHLMWRRSQIDAMGLELFHQENPTYPDEAFLSTGVSVFDSNRVQRRLEESATEKYWKRGRFEFRKTVDSSDRRTYVEDVRFVEDPTGDVTVYEPPRPGYPYVIGADPAGISGKDWFVAQVLRHDDSERAQVAQFRRQRMDPDEFGIQLYCLGTWYNRALIAVETNMGQAPNKQLAKAGYPRIYVRQDDQSYGEDVLNKYGVSTQGSNKEDMVNAMKARFRDRPSEFRDPTLLGEMLVYGVLDVGTRGNYVMGPLVGGAHDDCVMSYAIALRAAQSGQMTTAVNVAAKEASSLPFELRDTKRERRSKGIWASSRIGS